MKYPHMFAPLEIRGVRFKNRIIALELPSRQTESAGVELTQNLIDSYETLARGGAASVAISQKLSKPDDPVQRENYLMLAEILRCHSTVSAFCGDINPKGTKKSISELCKAVKAAVFAGCRMVILTGLYNPADEDIEGDPVKDALAAVNAVRDAAGENVVIAFKLACDDSSVEQYAAFCAMTEAALDMVIVCPAVQSSEFDDHGLILPLCEKFKALLRIPVAAAGGFNEPHQIENAILSGQCDLVAMSRQLLADPLFVRKTAELRESEITPCLRCGLCEADSLPNEPFQCAANPRVFREARLARVEPVQRPKKVLVVGAGPAGMYAALTAFRRGHHVRLVEKEKRIGGLLWYAGENSCKSDLRSLRDSLISHINASDIEVITGVAVGKDYIEKYAPDAVILAIGTEPAMSPIPGLAVFSHHALWAYSNPDKLGQRIVIIGGGLTGIECAIHLARDLEKDITVIESGSRIARGAYPAQYAAIERALPKNLHIKTSVRCTEVRPGGIVYRARNNHLVELAADTVLYAVGMQPKKAELAELVTAHPNTAVIGDCRSTGRLLQALRDGLFAAYDIS